MTVWALIAVTLSFAEPATKDLRGVYMTQAECEAQIRQPVMQSGTPPKWDSATMSGLTCVAMHIHPVPVFEGKYRP